MKRGMVLVLIIVSLVLISGCMPQKGSGGGIPEPLPQAPAGEVSVYKGFWMPTAFYYPYDSQAMTDAELLKDTGANIASFGPTVEINAEGDVRYSYPFNSVEDVDKQLEKLVRMYYGEGIRAKLVIELSYKEEFTAGGGEPQPIPRAVARKEGFLDKYNLIVEDMAKLAEKYDAEMFSPMNEVDRKLGSETASKWSQEILPVIRENYNGKVVFKGELFREAGSENIDFSGYDVIGFSTSPTGQISNYGDSVSKIIDDALEWAARDNVPEVMATEFGIWGGAVGLDEETKALAHRIVFEEGEGKLKGFFVLDPPADQQWSIKGTKSLEEITDWFKEKL